MSKQIAVRWLLRVSLVVLAGAIGVCIAVYVTLARSLPQIEGEVTVSGVTDAVEVGRSDRGVVTIEASSRLDVAFALGFVHGQERFFQMDLLRRSSAGELAELFGPVAVASDRRRRWHQFRKRAAVALARLEPLDRVLIEAYAEGVNTGLKELKSRPFEYILLRTDPVPWCPDDTLLVGFALYLDLQDGDGARDRFHGLIREALPEETYRFLTRNGSVWEALLEGERRPILPVPDLAGLGLLNDGAHRVEGLARDLDRPKNGSNAWAVGGGLAGGRGALVANDMHLKLAVPPIWFVAGWSYPDPETGEKTAVHGLTLPGTPVLVSGSNGRVAWGFTAAYADTQDVVAVERVSGADKYLTPNGPVSFERETEVIRIKGGDDQILEVVSTIWGPLIPEVIGSPLALSWVAHHPSAVDMGLVRMERVETVAEALVQAHQIGLPAENMIVGDSQGTIGWTICGPVPRRFGFDGSAPVSFAAGLAGWKGFLDSVEIPTVIRHSGGRVWSANERQEGGVAADRLGDGGMRSRGRSWEIRKHLMGGDTFEPSDFLEMQLDDRVTFLDRWQDLIIELIGPDAVAEKPARAQILELVEAWDGRASAESLSYPLIRTFRTMAAVDLFSRLFGRIGIGIRDFEMDWFDYEEALFQIVSQQSDDLTELHRSVWLERMLGWVDALIDGNEIGDGVSGTRSWGKMNDVRVRHRLSLAVPWLSRFLDHEPVEGNGDIFAINALRSAHGPSARMIVPVGSEEDGFLQIPGGQSGHPMSPYYRTGFEDWSAGRPVPFLPGETAHSFHLVPSR